MMMEIDEGNIGETFNPSKSSKVQPWVEKYRPRTVDDIAYQDEVVKTLKNAISTGIMPHLLFYGPPGTGKTSTILAVARSLFGHELYGQRILELNASDERGIKVVREKIKLFAQTAVGSSAGSHCSSCPSFKLIILDEADTMTSDAQAALRRTIEAYTKVTRFCLICNYVTRIIEPLASRCAKFRFRALSNETMYTRLRMISDAESVSISEDGIRTVIDLSGGDMRKAVTTLQSAHQLYTGTMISSDALIEVSGKVKPLVVEGLWKAIRSNKVHEVVKSVDLFTCEGSPLNALLDTLLEQTLNDETITDIMKASICEKLAQVDYALILGSTEELQLLDLCSLIMRTINK